MHTLISGQSFSGKSYLAKSLCSKLRKTRNCIVLDPFLDNWDADYLTQDADDFLRVAKRNRNCCLFVDESGSSIGRGADAARMHWIATQARHWGHRSFFILQRLTQIEPLIRSQCSEFYAFRGSANDAKILAYETGDDAFLRLPELPRYCFVHKKPFEPSKVQKLIG